MRACRARTVCLLPLLVSFSMLSHAPATARAPPCEKAAASFRAIHRRHLAHQHARAGLGRMPPMEASANRSITLTNAGFVALPE
jgi:hypothetical protein